MSMSRRPNDDLFSSRQFPWRLHVLLERCDEAGETSVSWLQEGKLFQVHDKERFAEKVMPCFFQSSTYKSFSRNLNLWGFKTVSKDHGRAIYYHEFFVRQQPDLCHQMTRCGNYTPKVRAAHSTVSVTAGPTNPTASSTSTSEESLPIRLVETPSNTTTTAEEGFTIAGAPRGTTSALLQYLQASIGPMGSFTSTNTTGTSPSFSTTTTNGYRSSTLLSEGSCWKNNNEAMNGLLFSLNGGGGGGGWGGFSNFSPQQRTVLTAGREVLRSQLLLAEALTQHQIQELQNQTTSTDHYGSSFRGAAFLEPLPHQQHLQTPDMMMSPSLLEHTEEEPPLMTPPPPSSLGTLRKRKHNGEPTSGATGWLDDNHDASGVASSFDRFILKAPSRTPPPPPAPPAHEEEMEEDIEKDHPSALTDATSSFQVVACRARAMPLDHNSHTAFFQINKAETAHGGDLVCSHAACQSGGIKFRYCAVCKVPASKRTFTHFHGHRNTTTTSSSSTTTCTIERTTTSTSQHQEQVQHQGQHHHQQRYTSKAITTIPEVHEDEDQQQHRQDTDYPSSASDSSCGPSKETEWERLLHQRPSKNAPESTMAHWIAEVLRVSDMGGDDDENSISYK